MLLNRLNDYLFKRIFGVPENKDILIDFLNSIILTDVSGPLVDLKLEDREIDPGYVGDKAARLDILATAKNGTKINIEVQLVNLGGPEKRTLFYWARLYGGQMVAGEEYPTLRPVITINVVSFEFLPYPDRFHQTFLLLEKDEYTPLTHDCEIHFLEIPKFRRQRRAPKTTLDDWLTYLSNVQGKALERVIMRQPAIKRALTIEEIFKQDERERREYELREKGLRDIRSLEAMARTARAEGLEEGIEKGIGKGRQEERRALARKLLDKGLSRAEVAELTGLSPDDIAALDHRHLSEEPAPYHAKPRARRSPRKPRS